MPTDFNALISRLRLAPMTDILVMGAWLLGPSLLFWFILWALPKTTGRYRGKRVGYGWFGSEK